MPRYYAAVTDFMTGVQHFVKHILGQKWMKGLCNGLKEQGSKKANWKKKLLKLYDFSVGVRPMGNKKPKKFAVNRAAWVKPPEDTVTKCLFGALDDHLCHGPLWGNDGVGERFYCGAPVEGKTYCHDHWFAATEPRHSRREPVRPFVINKRPANPPKSIVA